MLKSKHSIMKLAVDMLQKWEAKDAETIQLLEKHERLGVLRFLMAPIQTHGR
jgi:hypothetical protein